MKSLLTGFGLAAVAGFLTLPAAHAFPPAPDGLIYGMVRDQFGNPLQNPADTVILQTAGGVQVAGYVQPNLAIGVNYAVRVPVDGGITPTPYVANALTAGTAYKLYVVVGAVTNTPVEMEAGYLSLAGATQKTLQNLTIGADANSDGIPDAWETALLNSVGTNIALANINPNSIYTKDGRTLKQEFLLGNFPYNSNAFNVRLISLQGGAAVLAFNATAGRTHSVLGSSDLQNWSPLAFTIPANGSQANLSYYAPTNQALQIQTVQPQNAPTMQFFRLQLQ